MPPIIGTAMRCMISEPVPVLHMIGSSPAVIATTVIIFGRTMLAYVARVDLGLSSGEIRGLAIIAATAWHA
jgi:hypothetical protein